jgi:hypothetical protein
LGAGGISVAVDSNCSNIMLLPFEEYGFFILINAKIRRIQSKVFFNKIVYDYCRNGINLIDFTDKVVQRISNAVIHSQYLNEALVSGYDYKSGEEFVALITRDEIFQHRWCIRMLNKDALNSHYFGCYVLGEDEFNYNGDYNNEDNRRRKNNNFQGFNLNEARKFNERVIKETAVFHSTTSHKSDAITVKNVTQKTDFKK